MQKERSLRRGGGTFWWKLTSWTIKRPEGVGALLEIIPSRNLGKQGGNRKAETLTTGLGRCGRGKKSWQPRGYGLASCIEPGVLQRE